MEKWTESRREVRGLSLMKLNRHYWIDKEKFRNKSLAANANAKATQHTGEQEENWCAIYFAYFSFCIKSLI